MFGWAVVGTALVYIGLLFAIASWADGNRTATLAMANRRPI
jgi:hypothetical protein